LIGVEELLKDIPQAREWAEFDIADVTRIRGGSIRLDQWMEIARSVNVAGSDPAIDGVILTHGTFTLEETVYFLQLSVPVSKPVVCVASQRTHDSVGNDGDRNFLDAVRVALSPDAAGKGVLVVLHEEIHSARDVFKTSQRRGGFVSLAHGILGHVENDQVSFYHTPMRRHTSDRNSTSVASPSFLEWTLSRLTWAPMPQLRAPASTPAREDWWSTAMRSTAIRRSIKGKS
jgi:L-asparaginase/Glu-tRNA(Gln) amidotransferase subunit D